MKQLMFDKNTKNILTKYFFIKKYVYLHKLIKYDKEKERNDE